MNNLLDTAFPQESIQAENYSKDELISLLMEETERKPEWHEQKSTIEYDYPDFEDDTEQEPETDSLPDLDLSTPEKTFLAISEIPLEPVVDTLDIILTQTLVKFSKIEDYQGPEDQIYTTEAEKKSLVKAAQTYLASQDIKVSPLTGLILAFAMVYGKKLMICFKIKKALKRAAEAEEQNCLFQERISELEKENKSLKIKALKKEEKDGKTTE